ncbi:hypothetical protein U1Q18_023473, partial [Sarracenia purpurea var. burkii]
LRRGPRYNSDFGDFVDKDVGMDERGEKKKKRRGSGQSLSTMAPLSRPSIVDRPDKWVSTNQFGGTEPYAEQCSPSVEQRKPYAEQCNPSTE